MYNGYKSAALIIETDFLSCCKEFKEFFTEYDVPETDNEIIIEYDSDSIDEYLEPYSFFLKKNGYDMESNTIIVEGERIDAGEINFKDTRERLNRFFREHNFDQETDTFTLESDMGDTYVKTVSLDCLYPNEIIDNETSIDEYYESYIKMGELIEESFDPSIFQEGIGEAVKGGFTKVLGLLKKLLGFLKRQFLRFLNFMKGLFIKKTVSADQIMLSVNNSEFTSESYMVTESADGSEKITVTGAPGSEIKLDTIDVIIREFDIIVNSDASSLTFVFRAGSDVAKLKHAPAPQIEGHNRIGDPGVFETAVRLVKGEAVNNHTMYTLLDTLKNLFIAIREDIDKGSSSFQFFNVAKFKKVIEDLHALLDSRYPKNSDGLSNEISVSYSDIKRGFEAVNEVYKYADDIKNVDYNSISLDGNYKGHILTFAESAAGLLSRLTMNLNKLSSVMASLWVVNGTYRKSCNSIGVAAKLASEFIKHGIPSKYVRHNIMIVLSDELNTSPPKMGQSRCVFFPKDTAIVYKIAMNGFGVLSNRAEVEITKAVKQSVVRQEFIAPIIKNWKNFAVSQERCEFKQYTASQADAIIDKIKEVFADFKARNRGFKYNIMDLHDNNFARNRNGNYVIIDYGGWTHRAMGNMTGVGHVKSQLMN